MIIMNNTEIVYSKQEIPVVQNSADVQKLIQKYLLPRGISAQKKKHLIALCKKGYIPKQHHFYENLEIRQSNAKYDDDNIPKAGKSKDEGEGPSTI